MLKKISSRLLVAVLTTIFLSAAWLPVTASGATLRQREWSIDLAQYGYHAGYGDPGSYEEVAAAGNVIALGISDAVPSAHIDANHSPWNAPASVNVYIFKAADGKLIAKRGPWLGDYHFTLTPTAKGNFLLVLRHFNDGSEKKREELLGPV